jgi:hypothetical protein
MAVTDIEQGNGGLDLYTETRQAIQGEVEKGFGNDNPRRAGGCCAAGIRAHLVWCFWHNQSLQVLSLCSFSLMFAKWHVKVS